MTVDESKILMLYDTFTRRKQPFHPLEPGKVKMYVCGPTVYSDPHIGNFRAFIVGDILRRWLEYRGYEVFQIMNITDIDDKTIRDSGKEGISLKEFTERYTKSFLSGIDLLNIKRATVYPRATEHIPEMVEFIKGLQEKDFAYVADDGVYFDINKFPSYGKLSGVDLSSVRKTERMSVDTYDKETVNDFALWKRATEEEQKRGVYYDSPWGPGRPGWHIECSAMTRKYLGDTLDIHAGGEDLIFPHHENEIAQSEGLTGKEFVRYWMHNGFLMINGRKMSKSLGNYVTFDEVVSKYSPDSFRYFYLSNHYRKQIDYTEAAMNSAVNSAQKLKNTIDLVEEALQSETEYLNYTPREEIFLKNILKHKRKFESAMDDDLDTHRALDALHALSGSINEYIYDNPSKGVLLSVYSVYRKLLDVLGLFEGRTRDTEQLTKTLIDLIIRVRERLRHEKKFDFSDEIRKELENIGIIIGDKPDGTTWKFK